MTKIVSQRNKEKELEAKKVQKQQEQLMTDYFNAKIKGKSTNKDIFFSVKDDFEKFATMKGGPTKKVYEFMDKMIKRNEET
jgi:hypothetical protein